MTDIRHRIGFGFPSNVDVDGEVPLEPETFYLTTENGDPITTEDDNNIITENG